MNYSPMCIYTWTFIYTELKTCKTKKLVKIGMFKIETYFHRPVWLKKNLYDIAVLRFDFMNKGKNALVSGGKQDHVYRKFRPHRKGVGDGVWRPDPDVQGA